MDNLLNSVGYVGYAVGVLSAIFAYLNRDRYKTLVNDIYEPGNSELRKQVDSLRSEVREYAAKNTALEVHNEEKDRRINDLKELNTRLPDFETLTNKTNEVMLKMSNNHKEIVGMLTKLGGSILASKDSNAES